MSKGQINVYTCISCGRKAVTVDREEGVTPFTITCPFCEKSEAQSHFYRVPQDLDPMYEWYKPDEAELGDLMSFEEGRDVYDNHIKRGGLVMRKIGGPTFTETLMKKLKIEVSTTPHSFCNGGCETSCQNAKQTASEDQEDFLKIQELDEFAHEGPALYVSGCEHCGLWSLRLVENVADLGAAWIVMIEHLDDLYDVVEAAQYWCDILKTVPALIEPGHLEHALGHQVKVLPALVAKVVDDANR